MNITDIDDKVPGLFKFFNVADLSICCKIFSLALWIVVVVLNYSARLFTQLHNLQTFLCVDLVNDLIKNS